MAVLVLHWALNGDINRTYSCIVYVAHLHRYEDMPHDSFEAGGVPPFMYGTHYSTPGLVGWASTSAQSMRHYGHELWRKELYT
jgi:hypothetical protein